MPLCERPALFLAGCGSPMTDQSKPIRSIPELEAYYRGDLGAAMGVRGQGGYVTSSSGALVFVGNVGGSNVPDIREPDRAACAAANQSRAIRECLKRLTTAQCRVLEACYAAPANMTDEFRRLGIAGGHALVLANESEAERDRLVLARKRHKRGSEPFKAAQARVDQHDEALRVQARSEARDAHEAYRRNRHPDGAGKRRAERNRPTPDEMAEGRAEQDRIATDWGGV